MVAQDELRRRIRAAMALHGISSWEELAEITPFSRSLLKDLGTPRGVADERHLRSIAAACHVPYAWFTVPDLAAAVEGAEDASLDERVEALERRLAASQARGADERPAVVTFSGSRVDPSSDIDVVVDLPDGGRLMAEVKATMGEGKTGEALERAVSYLVMRMAALEATLDAQGRTPVQQLHDATRAAIDATRGVKEVASASAGDVRTEREPADQARDEEDAIPGSARAASGRTPRGRR